MSGKVGNAPDCVALNFDIWRHHLSDEGRQTTELDDGNLVFSYSLSVVLNQAKRYCNILLTARFPNAALAAL